MTFCEVSTAYSIEKRKRLFQSLTPQEYYNIKLTNTDDKKRRLYLKIENKWYEYLKPYYKIYCDMDKLLQNTNINIPTEMFKMPYDCFACILDRDDKLGQLMYDNDEELKKDIYIDSDFESYSITDFLVCLERNKLQFSFGHYKTHKIKSNTDITVSNSDKEYRSFVVDLTSGNDLDSCYVNGGYWKTIKGEITAQYRIYKIAVQVALLATNSAHEFIDPDILKADMGKYYDPQTTDDEKKILAQRARDKGKRGWVLGRGRSLQLLNKQSVIPLDARNPSKFQRQYQSLRCGHWHTVCHGKERKNRKLMWFPPTMVRPDLPLPEINK